MKKTIIAISLHVDKWGAERSMCSALNALNNNGYHVILIIPKSGPIEELLKYYNIHYHIIPLVPACSTVYKKKYFIKYILRYYLYNFISNIKIICYLRNLKIRPSIIYTNTIVPSNGLYLSRFYNIPHVVHIRENAKLDFDFHFFLGKKHYLNLLNHNLSFAICISKFVQNTFIEYFGQKTVLLYNGLPIPKQKLYIENVHENITNILFVGRLSKEKGLWDCLEVVKRLIDKGYNIRLEIWGKGKDKDVISEFITKNDLVENIVLKGFSDTIPYSKYEIAIMSSPNEAFGRTTVEYMLNNIAVIANKGGATPEIIENNTSGLLYSNIDEFSNKLELLINNKELRNRLKVNAYKRAIDYFSENKYLYNIINLFSQIK